MNGKGQTYKSGGRFWKGSSRSEKMASNNLGIISSDNQTTKCRSQKLKEVEGYVNGTIYNGLTEWEDARCSENYIPTRKRKPKIIYPFAEVFGERISSKVAGYSTFPKIKIEDDEEANYLLQLIVDGGFLKPRLLSAAKLLAIYNSVFVRFYFAEGMLKVESYNSNYCYPVFSDGGTLQEIEIKYVYDSGETDDQGKPIFKWYRLLLSESADIEFDNPVFDSSSQGEPEFTEVSRNDHQLGFVQGEWISIGESSTGVDGDREPFIFKIKGFIDSLNYNLSQTDQANEYGLEPQLKLTGIDEEEVETLIKSSAKAWALGREGKAEYLEVAGSGIETAQKVSMDFYKKVQDIARIVMLDPEKIVGSAQSAKAMEVLHGPMVELINEIRPWFEKGYNSLCEKIMTAIIVLTHEGFQTQFIVPDGWIPQSTTIKAVWPPIFELTTQDKQQLVSMGIQTSNANLVSRQTIGQWLQNMGVDFGIDDWELEVQKINSQQQFNTFF